MNPFKAAVHALGRLYTARTLPPTGGDRRGVNERPLEYAFALRALQACGARSALDVGTGTGCWPTLLSDCGYSVTAVDQAGSYWNGRYFNRHFRVMQHDITAAPVPGRFDAITCLSVLEHIPQPQSALRNMAASCEKVLVLTFPYSESEYVPNAYDLPDAGYGKGEPYVTQIYNRAMVDQWLAATGLRIVAQEYARCFTGRFWTVGERLIPMQCPVDPADAHLACLALAR